MRTLRLHGPGDLRLYDEPVPTVKSGETLLRVAAVGICGSDLHWFTDAGIGDARLETPLVLGHEAAAYTEDGTLVAVDPAVPCGECEFCREGNPNLCERLIFAGHGRQDGFMLEQVAWSQGSLFPLPQGFTPADGVMLEPLGIAIHAMDLAHLKLGMRVGIFGCGPIGLLIMQLARLAGASEIIATDVLPHRLEAATRLGADQVFLASDPHARGEIAKAAGPHGLEVTFEVAGENDAVETAIANTRPGGKVMLVGIPGNDYTTFTASVARRKGLTLKLVRRMKNTYPRAIHLVGSGQLDVRSLITHSFPLEQAAEAFAVASRREGLKVVIQIS